MASHTPNTDNESTNVLDILNVKPGVLNDLMSDEIDFESIDFDMESVWSVMGRTITKAFTQNKLKSAGEFIGILLREENNPKYKIESNIDIAIKAAGMTDLELKKFRVRIPCIHFGLPLPGNMKGAQVAYTSGGGSPELNRDNKIIDMYTPVFEAIDTVVGEEKLSPGDLVRVSYTSKGALTGGKFLGAVKSDRPTLAQMQAVANAAAGAFNQGNCKGLQSTNAATGDQNNSGKFTFPAGAMGTTTMPLIQSGKGHGKVEIIAGPNAKSGVVSAMKGRQKGSFYQGIVYVDKFASNGKLDDVAMKGGPGRSTVIYMPATCNASQPIELIYWFHGIRGFGALDLGKRIKNSCKQMKKQRRNFIMVVSEQLWSLESADKSTGIPRQKTSSGASGWTDREWGCWGYNPEVQGSGPSAMFNGPGKKPRQWRKPKYQNAGPEGQGGNFAALHGEVLGVLKKHFGLTKSRPSTITIMGHSAGGAPIGMGVRTGQLQQIKPDKIVFSDASYSGTKENGYLDGDVNFAFYEYVAQNPHVVLEIHVGYGTDPKGPGFHIAGWTSVALIGLLMDTIKKNPKEKNYKKLAQLAIEAANKTLSQGYKGMKPSISESEAKYYFKYG